MVLRGGAGPPAGTGAARLGGPRPWRLKPRGKCSYGSSLSRLGGGGGGGGAVRVD
eukprot:COSAG01_NODE_22490_length_853_cov_7.152520_1_plen_54_part_10